MFIQETTGSYGGLQLFTQELGCMIVVSPASGYKTGAHHGYTSPIAYLICKLATSQAKWSCHSTSQLAYDLLSTSWYILPADRSLPGDKLQATNNILYCLSKMGCDIVGCVARSVE